MEQRAKILLFSGSTRKESLNKKLLNESITCFDSVEIEYIDLKDYPLSIYNGDDEASNGVPENARKLRNKMIASDGFVIASPEYNSAISPLLKNTIDWTSRADGDIASLAAFKHKACLLLSASPGELGGLRGLYSLRSILSNIGVMVYPELLSLQLSTKSFDEQGSLLDIETKDRLNNLTAAFQSHLNAAVRL